MFSDIKNYIIAGLILIITILYIGYLHVKIQRDGALAKVSTMALQVEQQNAAVEQWRKEAKASESRVRESEKVSKERLKRAQKEMEMALKADVPLDCAEAAGWATQEAIEMSNQ
jgi:hypothetical protein